MQRNIAKTIQRTYQAWLTHREYSPATIQKYTKALARFFSDTGAGKIPDRETVAAWRDALAGQGYSPATVNGLLAAVNMYQESINSLTADTTVTFTNRKELVGPPTGLERNATPYTILVTVAGIAGLALIGGILARRRRRRME